MPIPRGFVEVHPLEEPPFLAPVHLRQGAIVKFHRSRERTGTDHSEETDILNGYIARGGAGLMVHEFTTRSGLGLPFKLVGEPTLTARLCAIKQGWIIWIQRSHAGTWEVGAAFDLVKLQYLAVRMREVDDELDRAILESAGAFQAGTRSVGIEDITTAARNPHSERARERAEKAKAPGNQRRVRAFLRTLVAGAPRALADVRRAFDEKGWTREQLETAAEELGAVVCRTTKKGPGTKRRLIRLASNDSYPVRVIAETPTAVRREIARDIEEEASQLRENARRASLDQVRQAPPKGESIEAECARWIREQLAGRSQRLGDLRREMPAPEDSDQVRRDEWFLAAATAVGVTVHPRGPGRLRGYWLSLTPADAELERNADPLRRAMEREGSPHIEYPKPRHWF